MNHDGKFFSNFKSSHKDLAKNSKVRLYKQYNYLSRSSYFFCKVSYVPLKSFWFSQYRNNLKAFNVRKKCLLSHGTFEFT